MTRASIASALAGAAAILVIPGLAWAQRAVDPGSYPYGPHMMWGGGWYGMVLGPLFMIVVLVAVIATIVILVRSLGHGPHHAPPPWPQHRSPVDILKERFARGEIDKAEFEERRRVLGD